MRALLRMRHRALAFYISLCMISIYSIICYYAISRHHYLRPDLVRHLLSTHTVDGHAQSKIKDIQTLCRAHGFAAADDSEYPRKVYDLVLLSTELDWLEIRLHTMANYVDYFVVVESPTTFTGHSKPLLLKDHWDLFEDFHHKIIYRVVEDQIQSQRIWDHEDFLRDALLNSVFPELKESLTQANIGDVLVVSDMDEILRPETVLVLRNCRIPARLTLRTHFYFYSFQWLHQGPQWSHPDATVYRGPATITPNDLRQGLLGKKWTINAALRRWWDRGTLWNAGWHCSSCFATVSETVTKMNSFSHQGWNTAKNRDPDTLVTRVRGGKDLFGRTDQRYLRVDANADVPSYIAEQNQRDGKFGYLLNRDGESAGYTDYTASNSLGLPKQPQL